MVNSRRHKTNQAVEVDIMVRRKSVMLCGWKGNGGPGVK